VAAAANRLPEEKLSGRRLANVRGTCRTHTQPLGRGPDPRGLVRTGVAVDLAPLAVALVDPERRVARAPIRQVPHHVPRGRLVTQQRNLDLGEDVRDLRAAGPRIAVLAGEVLPNDRVGMAAGLVVDRVLAIVDTGREHRRAGAESLPEGAGHRARK